MVQTIQRVIEKLEMPLKRCGRVDIKRCANLRRNILQGDIFGIDLPFIGDKLRTEANLVEQFRATVRE